MKERPILFNSDMVRAILDGRKTQTRRIVKPQPDFNGIDWYIEPIPGLTTPPGLDEIEFRGGRLGFRYYARGKNFSENLKWECPFGKIGDVLWVRENFSRHVITEFHRHHLPADRLRQIVDADCGFHYWADGEPEYGDWERTKPSIHMPKEACRIKLEITDIRVERLNDISETDAKSEGMFFTDYGRNCFHNGSLSDVGDCPADDSTHPQRRGWSFKETSSHNQCLLTAKTAFWNLWNSINGADSWDENPWVWVVEFKRI